MASQVARGKGSACNAEDPGLIHGGKISWRREWLLTPVFLPREFHGQKSLDGKESAYNEGDLGSTLDWEDPLEEGMAAQSGILT